MNVGAIRGDHEDPVLSHTAPLRRGGSCAAEGQTLQTVDLIGAGVKIPRQHVDAASSPPPRIPSPIKCIPDVERSRQRWRPPEWTV